MPISLELVPRMRESFVSEVRWAKEHISAITHINIPDLTRLETRSWEASSWVEGIYPVIVHVRACDVKPEQMEDFYHTLKSYKISQILVIQGDQKSDEENKGMTSLEMLSAFRQLDSSLMLYAAIDPYRHSLSEEMKYVEQKLKAGAQAFLTQPFFEKGILEEYMTHCQGLSVWWGISPILTEKSLAYWQEKNHVPIGKGYDISLEGNITWARFVLERVMRQKGYALYLMPIRVDISTYLPPLFEKLS
ncbi:MAG: methylenetetrahydrofolate reductase [Brevinematales bacterium]